MIEAIFEILGTAILLYAAAYGLIPKRYLVRR